MEMRSRSAVQFESAVDAYMTGVALLQGQRQHRHAYRQSLDVDRPLLATATFTNETSSGWQQVNFSTPVLIRADTVYVVSYYAPNGHYSVKTGYFTSQGASNGPLQGLASGPAGANGLYSYGADAFPITTYGQSNYWVDVTINTKVTPDMSPPTVVS